MSTDCDKALLKADGIFFDVIYADLMTLLKSTELQKTYLDMNSHYLELLNHLQLISQHPRLSLDPNQKVFHSELRLYEESKLNHRTHPEYLPVREKLYSSDEYDEEFTLPLIASATTEMALKLASYKEDQLPGGKHWAPSPSVREALKNVEATNDACESVLGLNDWLQKTTPNMAQRTVSAMVQTKKNKTLEWLLSQNQQHTDSVINLARSKAKTILKETKQEEEEHRLHRKCQRKVDEEKMHIKKIRLEKKREELAKACS